MCTVPKINFNGEKYYDIIDWKKVEITEPPLTKTLSEEELMDIVSKGENSELWHSEIFQLPCHTQAVERCVKLVTEASRKVADDIRRDGYIRTVLGSRALMPSFETKNDYRLH
jgi:hypothetical protein